ncbi:TPA: hypothetical protein HA238_01560 [Candidatus Micrarchaeota archaeon]|nr:hypothetical protein [Candidatus Micrarchaeota archaeon]
MPSKQEIESIISWCEERRKEKKQVYLIERNQFSETIEWMRRFTLIEIGRPKEIASKTSLVYDPIIKTLWQFINGTWQKVTSDGF